MNDATQTRNAARDGRRDERDAAADRYASRRAHCHTEASRDEEDNTLAKVQAFADNHGADPGAFETREGETRSTSTLDGAR